MNEEKTYVSVPMRPLSLNSLIRFGRGICYKVPKAKKFEKNIQQYIKDCPKITGEVSLTIIYRLKGKRSIDIDNASKLLIDCLKNKLFEDDKMVMSLYAEKVMNCNKDEIQVLVKKI